MLDKDKISLFPAGDLLEESQSEASRLRQRVEELVRDNEALKSSSFAASLCMGGPVQSETQSRSHRLWNESLNLRIRFIVFKVHLCMCSIFESVILPFLRQNPFTPYWRAGRRANKLCRENASAREAQCMQFYKHPFSINKLVFDVLTLSWLLAVTGSLTRISGWEYWGEDHRCLDCMYQNPYFC